MTAKNQKTLGIVLIGGAIAAAVWYFTKKKSNDMLPQSMPMHSSGRVVAPNLPQASFFAPPAAAAPIPTDMSSGGWMVDWQNEGNWSDSGPG